MNLKTMAISLLLFAAVPICSYSDPVSIPDMVTVRATQREVPPDLGNYAETTDSGNEYSRQHLSRKIHLSRRNDEEAWQA